MRITAVFLWLLDILLWVFIGSVISVITMSALISYYSGEQLTILGASWWEAFTAIGTTFAVVVALIVGLGGWVRAEIGRQRQAGVIEILVVPWLGEMTAVASRLTESLPVIINLKVRERLSDRYKEHIKWCIEGLQVSDTVLPFSADLGDHNYGVEIADIISLSWRLHKELSCLDMSDTRKLMKCKSSIELYIEGCKQLTTKITALEQRLYSRT